MKNKTDYLIISKITKDGRTHGTNLMERQFIIDKYCESITTEKNKKTIWIINSNRKRCECETQDNKNKKR